MVFSSVIFLFYFLPATILLYSISPKAIKNYTLLLFSLIFYAWGEPSFVFVMIFSIILNYIFGIILGNERIKAKKLVLVLSVIFNIGLLFVFKYLNFAFDTITTLLSKIGISPLFTIPEIALPIGLSFFTFQGMSYVIDVYRKDVEVQRNPFNLALYISMFPQLIAGPIVRYSDVNKEIIERKTTLNDVYEGVMRFIVGLGKKVIIADILASVSDALYNSEVSQLTPSLSWVAAGCYFFQIFFDFSGYSDMAIGLGRIFGFHFLENFNLPYISKSITEFWRRWHMSLGSWFRDYVYIPLGGSRKGNVYFNLFVVFLLTGIWHGATFSFILWGIWNAIFIVSERFLKKKFSIKIPSVLQWLYTMFVVFVGWILFRANSISDAITVVKNLFGASSDVVPIYTASYYLSTQVIISLCAAVVLSFGIPKLLIEKFPLIKKVSKYTKPIFLIIVFYFSICMIVNGNYSPFIYFRF